MKIKFKKSLVSALVLAFVLLIVWYFNNFTIKTVYQSITSQKVSEEINIAVISDLHSYSFGKDNKRITETLEEMVPDLIFVLGDMHSRHQERKIPETVDFIKRLSDITDVYIVTGDHDYSQEYKEKLRELDRVTLLDYINKDIEIKGNKLSIYGIDNVYFSSTFDLKNAFDELDKDRINILLSHIPSIESYGDFGFDFIFCGDTHGGMIRLPLLDGLYFNGYILPKITYKGDITDKGLYQFKNTSLFVTSGLGNYPLPLRFNNRPEICLITIKGE